LAQSAAGKDEAGAVTVAVAGDISAQGMDSDAIHAQSVGNADCGRISVNIVSGVIRGGSGTGAGVNLDGGRNNTLANSGSISALSGTAILGSTGNDVVDNSGIIVGSVGLGSGANCLNNLEAAVFESGATVNLGDGNTLNNRGTLSPGGSGAIIETMLIGDLDQSASGILEIEIGGTTPGSFDAVRITGTAFLAGTINFSFLSDYYIASEIGPGESVTLPFLSAGDLSNLSSTVSYAFSGSLFGFEYDLLQKDDGLVLQAVNTVPEPNTIALLVTALSLVAVVGCLRKRWVAGASAGWARSIPR
jgi:hypothetical protein